MGRIVTITAWPEDHNVPTIAVNEGEFVIPFNSATTIPDNHFSALKNAAAGTPGIKFTDGGSTGEPAASLTVTIKGERTHRTR